MDPSVQERIRARLEERERSLSPFASRSQTSKGRLAPEEPAPYRTEFQRDRDRIIHSKAFRRLKHKTQVFIAPLGDHYVTRLTHTLEVAQIGRTIARALNLNEDLVEAMALGHDLGHTPFGHVGEQVLDRLYPLGFHHNVQSLRVVDVLEKDGQGLNLTWETRQGIVSHSKGRGNFLVDGSAAGLTLEAQVCRLADAIAYINHDIGDAFRAGVLTEDDLPGESTRVLGNRHSQRIDTMVTDVVESSWEVTGEKPLPKEAHPSIGMSAEVGRVVNNLREFLFHRVYIPASQGEEGQKAQEALEWMYGFLLQHPQRIPLEYHQRQEPVERMVVDHIASMTDGFALRVVGEIRGS